MNEQEIKVGNYIGALDRMWRGKKPFQHGLKVVAVNKRIKCEIKRFSDDDYVLLRQSEVLAVFPDKEAADTTMRTAFEIWEKEQKTIDSAIADRDNAVLQAITGASHARD